ncbi:hypothetical protein [Erythrobacter sp. JK5]|uniref:hypothetical protein n=1 Tax=Erythrobacter sp. JK5 TaxID=2829500 RepID=UPI001BA7886B|nr:hypothetical protein [Erythrobacter sp. JK5]QUL38131.1 hypothetical protein KDC96_01525 [Erythrobacter sp. JK5]
MGIDRPTSQDVVSGAIETASETAPVAGEAITEPADSQQQAGAQSVPQSPRAEVIGGYEILPSDFSLDGQSGSSAAVSRSASGTIAVRKPVFVGNTSIGSIPINVDDDAQLYVEARQLKSLLTGQPRVSSQLASLPERGPVSFQRLRQMGIDLRYDPTLDRVNLRPN